MTLRFEAKHPEVENNQGQSIYYFHEEQFFDVMENYGIEGVENCEIYLVYDPNIGIIEYQPEIFEDIRRRAGIDEDKFKNSFFTKVNLKKLACKSEGQMEKIHLKAYLFTIYQIL